MTWGASVSRHVATHGRALLSSHTLHIDPLMGTRALLTQTREIPQGCGMMRHTHPCLSRLWAPDLAKSMKSHHKVSWARVLWTPGQGPSLEHGSLSPLEELVQQQIRSEQSAENKYNQWLWISMCTSHSGPEWKARRHLLIRKAGGFLMTMS